MKKTEQLLVYLMSKYQHSSVTSLMKLCYLVDLVNITETKKQISDFTYKRYYFGPFDKRIYTYLETLTAQGIIIPKSDYDTFGNEQITYIVNQESKDISFDTLAQKEINVIDSFLEKVKGYGAKALTEITYKTKPMKALGATLGGNEHLNADLNLSLVK